MTSEPVRDAENVAVPRRWCVAHRGLVVQGNLCEYVDHYETPCVPRRLFIEDPSALIDGRIAGGDDA